MNIFAGKMRFDLPDSWVDNTVYEYRSADGDSSIEVRRDVFTAPYNLPSVAGQKLALFRDGVAGATATSLSPCKAGEFDGLFADVSFPGDGGKKVMLRLVYIQPNPNTMIGVTAIAGLIPWRDFTGIVNLLLGSFRLDASQARNP